MKILFDQNISHRIIKKIIHIYPLAQQIRQLGLENATDIEIWEYAKINDYTIVTFDADFVDIANYKGHPPKIIWLRIGNTTTNGIASIMLTHFKAITDFILTVDNEKIACLEIE